MYKPSRNPRLPFSDLARDAGFLECVALLREAGIPVLMILLPTLTDLRNHGYVMDSQQKDLLASLRRETDLHLVRLRRFIRVPEAEWPTLFLPGDGHPPPRGAEVFAEAIAESIAEALTRNEEPSETGP